MENRETIESRTMTAELIYDLQIVSDPQISPDGKHVLFGVQRVDRVKEKKYTNLWIVSTGGGEPRQFTYGDQVDQQARWSPDGKEIAFFSNRTDGEQEQVYIIPFYGGEGRPLTSLKGSFAALEWSPDGRSLALQFRKKDAETIEREADEQKKKLGVVARHVTSLEYKLDGAGYLPQEKWHIWTIDVPTGATFQITDGIYNEEGPRWSPDGSRILFTSNRSKDPAKEVDAIDLYLIPAHGGKMERVETRYGHKTLASFSPDGQWIAYLGREQTGRFYQNTNLFVVPTAGGESRNLSKAFDLHLTSATNTDVGSGTAQTPPSWSQDGQWIYVQATERSNQPLVAIPVNGAQATLQRVVAEPGVVGSFSLDAAQERVAYLWGTMDSTGQVAVRGMPGETPLILTGFNRSLLAELDLGAIEEVNIKTPGGSELQGWILRPPGFDPAVQYPSVLEIHGGPQTQYGRVFMHEFYFLAAQGYIVHWCNPRGSQGYGEAFSGAIFNNWGSVDYDDIMAWTDFVQQLPYIDSQRMGVTGGSYGGYMTATIISRTPRFKAAVAQRLVSNFISFYGSSDMNIMTEELAGIPGPPWADLENYWRVSPISNIGNAVTPTLIIHSERDFRCDREQGEQVFVALQRLGVDSEMVLFPDESHGLSREGRTDRRVARLQHVVRWFEKYLKSN